MRILYIDWPCFGAEDTINYFREEGHEIITFSHDGYQDRYNEGFNEAFRERVDDMYIDC